MRKTKQYRMSHCINPDLIKNFKSLTSLKGISMKSVLDSLIEKWIQREEAKRQ